MLRNLSEFVSQTGHMTTTISPTRQTATSYQYSERLRRKRRASRLSLWRDGLLSAAWLSVIGGLAFFLASGAMRWSVQTDMLNAFGRFTAIIATTLILIQVVLVSRAPWVERALGHDKAAKLHSSLGEPIFYLLIAHAALLTVGWGAPQGRDFLEQTMYFYNRFPNIALSIAGLALFLIVAVTSVTAVRRRWPYETWHVIHLLTYGAIAMSVPHQFYDGSTFRANQAATWYWIGLYVVAFGSLLAWRVVAPMWRAAKHRLRVSEVERHDDGTVSVTISGRKLDEWDARAGQFFLWRFATADLWLTSHPYSLSAAPDGRTLRITVKPLGDDSAVLSGVRPGTRVMAAGPFGRFSHHARTGEGLVLVGAGIGVTPIRAMLEDPEVMSGPCTVIIRARSVREAPLISELRELAEQRGANFHLLVGPRGSGWSTQEGPESLDALVPDLPTADVFVCGPEAWSGEVARDALECGVPSGAIHVEEYAW